MNNIENSFSATNYTEQIVAYMSDLENRIYDIEDHVSSLDENVTAIISYLNSVHSTLPFGMAIRRHLCGRFGKKTDKGYDFVLQDGSKVSTSDFLHRFSGMFIKGSIPKLRSPNLPLSRQGASCVRSRIAEEIRCLT